MCGRYFFRLEHQAEFQRLRKKIEQQELFEYAQEEIFPSQQALVLIAGSDTYQLDIMRWGLQGSSSRLLINARSEGIENKKTFQPMLQHRCLIPCNGFFEWITNGKYKQKVYIHKEQEPLFYLAGLYNDKKEFVIVTGESYGDMKHIHQRTPILLSEAQISSYLSQQRAFEPNNETLQFDKEESKPYQQLELFSQGEVQ